MPSSLELFVRRLLLRTFFSIVCVALAAAAPAGAAFAQQPDDGKKDLKLDALGGVSVQVPGWKEVRRDAAVAVLEQAPEPAANKPYYVLMCAFEEGPPAGAPIAWDKVRDNIVTAASKNGRKLTLELKEPFTGAAAFEGRRLVGEFTSATPNRTVAIELLALVKDAKLLTIGLIAEALGPETNQLVQGIAKSAKIP